MSDSKPVRNDGYVDHHTIVYRIIAMFYCDYCT